MLGTSAINLSQVLYEDWDARISILAGVFPQAGYVDADWVRLPCTNPLQTGRAIHFLSPWRARALP
jgi:hypothetical protein